MRIGLIVGPGFPVPLPNYGGIERVVDTLARGFAAAGHDVLLAGPSDSSCPVPLAAGMWESDSTRRSAIPPGIPRLRPRISGKDRGSRLTALLRCGVQASREPTGRQLHAGCLLGPACMRLPEAPQCRAGHAAVQPYPGPGPGLADARMQ